MDRGGGVTYSNGELQNGECHITSLHHLGLNSEHNTFVQQHRQWIEV